MAPSIEDPESAGLVSYYTYALERSATSASSVSGSMGAATACLAVLGVAFMLLSTGNQTAAHTSMFVAPMVVARPIGVIAANAAPRFDRSQTQGPGPWQGRVMGAAPLGASVGSTDQTTEHLVQTSEMQVGGSWFSSLSALLAGLAAMTGLWAWRRSQRAPAATEYDWNMANISVNPELLKRFGLDTEGVAYPGLAESILARKAPGGVPAAADDEASGYLRSDLQERLDMAYLSMNLDTPGLKVHSVDPPVLTIDGFLNDAECDALMSETPSILQQSTIGSGRLFEQGTQVSARRTSASVLLDEGILASRPNIAAPNNALQKRAQGLFPGSKWDIRGQIPTPGHVCFEALQVARYTETQQFMEHQDAFPLMTARKNQFQRLATVLVYLNDVAEGGTTDFTHLDLSITPKKGMALVFFPGYIDGLPDDRMLHEATPAISEKWVAQQWVAVGVAPGNALRVPTAATTSSGEDLAAKAADLEAQNKALKAKMAALEEHNARAMALQEAKRKTAKKTAKKDRSAGKLGPKKGFGA